MKTHLVSYATPQYRSNQSRLEKTGLVHGIDRAWSFGHSDLMGMSFFEENRDLLSASVGAGYFLWKPFFIREVLSQVADGDLVFYIDCGVAITADLKPLKELVQGDIPFGFFRVQDCVNREWTKRDCFLTMGCDSFLYWDAPHINAAFLVLRKCELASRFVDEWIHFGKDPRCISDQPNTLGLENFPEFIAHRWDQSILSLLVHKAGLSAYRDPSQFGNYEKLPKYRKPGEYSCAAPYYGPPLPISNIYSQVPDAVSDYDTVFDHHRIRRPFFQKHFHFFRLFNLCETFARKVVRKVRDYIHSNSKFLEIESIKTLHEKVSSDLSIVQEVNRKTLRGVNTWKNEEAFSKSWYGYGMPPQIARVIDLPVGSSPTYADVMLCLARRLPKPVRYLEIGVSVGKTFLQVLESLQAADLTAFDIEDMHPVLKSKLSFEATRLNWQTPDFSKKKSTSSLATYRYPPNDNKVTYLCGDVFDRRAWAKLKGNQYNLIFSDAFHSAQAIRYEYRMLFNLGLLDLSSFLFLWDDLEGPMERAFKDICTDLCKRVPSCRAYRLSVNGWVGENESKHRVGLITNL